MLAMERKSLGDGAALLDMSSSLLPSGWGVGGLRDGRIGFAEGNGCRPVLMPVLGRGVGKGIAPPSVPLLDEQQSKDPDDERVWILVLADVIVILVLP